MLFLVHLFLLWLTQLEKKTLNSTHSLDRHEQFIKIQKEPVPFIEAMPLESNFLDWHFVITGRALHA